MIKQGDKITCKDLTVTVDQIHSQSNYGTDDEPCYYIEFRDTDGVFRYWKQDVDGGFVTPAPMLVFECEECGFTLETDNEDEWVSASCPLCYPDSLDNESLFTDLGTRAQKFCGCEDYPCCGH